MMDRTRLWLPLIAAVSLLIGCGRELTVARTDAQSQAATDSASSPDGSATEEGKMNITSPAFQDHGPIPVKYTCDGNDTIPPLEFENVPPDAKSLALVMNDPDVPPGVNPTRNWDHWVVYDIPADLREIREGEAPEGVTGKNSWGKNQYGGPCPPDRQHRYFFRLYALDESLDLPPFKTGRPEVLDAMKGHVLAEAELVGVYGPKKK
ncbi:MAG: YbhB/YbcL family Raf kinase inhibitor-like protein [Thermoanaerobaculia bacterium]